VRKGLRRALSSKQQLFITSGRQEISTKPSVAVIRQVGDKTSSGIRFFSLLPTDFFFTVLYLFLGFVAVQENIEGGIGIGSTVEATL
jgi:hypothetical protein